MRRAFLIGAMVAVLSAALFYASGMNMRPGSFSLHMGAHLLLSLGAAPLLILALPHWRPHISGPLAFLALNVVTYGVHLPAVYARLMTPGGMLIESLLFLGAGLLFWARVARGGLGAALLLLAQMAACALLGAAITFSRDAYAMTLPDDTALGGVLMWVVGGFVVMAAAFYHFMLVLKTAETRNEQTV
ncbi:cytochrome c oxidase assembly protein [Deinococcus sp. SM5_A1]|uniref:cytochrome c oxidase assembly protein n=1 Tax=Deinococcus sp. SM5_A1 TaxID=3379094 RepID=UPI00385C48D9